MRKLTGMRVVLLAGFAVASSVFFWPTPSCQADDWPQWLGPQRDGIWRESGILKKFPESGLKVRWRTPIAAGYAGPAVAQGRVYVTDRLKEEGMPSRERVLCLNEADGSIVWKYEYDCPYKVSYSAGPRTTPVVHEGKVYTLGTEGNLYCLEAASGKVVWSHEYKKELKVSTPEWGFSAHPLIYKDKLICLARGNGSTVLAYDKNTGTELWRALSAKEPGYAPPMVYQFADGPQLIVWHPEAINGLNPDTGKTLWTQPFTARVGMSIATPRAFGNRLFFTCFYNGPIMLEVQKANVPTVVWRGKGENEYKTDGIHSVFSTPFFDGDNIYGVCSYGQLRCLNAKTGERLWSTLQATTDGKEVRWGNTFLIKQEDRFFLPNEKGDLIIARLTPQGYEEVSRTHLLDPTNRDCGRMVVWSHPAFANRCIYARNDKEILCASLAEE